MVELQTRPPTGQVAYPLILVEHEEKAGGSAALASFASSPRVGRTFVLDTGDGTADEYAALGPYEILVHDGTWPSIIGQIEAATKAPRVDPEKPNVVGIDHGSAIWLTLKAWTDSRARRSSKGKATLAADPDAEIDAPMNLWNDSKARWARMLLLLKNFDGIGVLLAHGMDVTKVENGVPTKESVWSTEAEKTTEGVASAIVRIRRDPRTATLVGVRALNAAEMVPTGGLVLPLPMEGLLDHLVFEILGAGGFSTSTAVASKEGTPTLTAMAQVLTAVQRKNGALSEEEAKAEAGRLWMAVGLPKGVEEVDGDKVTALLLAIAEDTAPPPPEAPPEDEGQKGTTPPQEPQDGLGEGAPPDAPPAQEEATEPPVDPVGDGALSGTVDLVGVTYSQADARHWLDDARRPALVQVCKVEKIAATGQTEEIRARLFAHFALHDEDHPAPDVEEAAANVAEAFGGAEEVELIDVPDGWLEARCLCGEPFTYPPGKAAEGKHLDPTIDANHSPEEPF